jgi:hypothetical protein
MKLGLLACLPAAFLAVAPVRAADVKPDYGSVVKDLEIMDRSGDRFTLVFWMPPEFWRVAVESSGKLTDKAIKQITDTLQPYTIVAVIDADVGMAANFKYADLDTLKSSVSIEDAHANVYHPLNADQIDGGVTNLVDMMRPVLSNAMGAMGSHMEFLVFSNKSKDGKPLADVAKEGMFTVHVGPKTARFRLPLGSFLPPVFDEKTGETFPGSYHFNPFTGNKLSSGAPAKTPPAGSK